MVQIKAFLARSDGGGASVVVRETNKSWIFLTPTHVFKLKKQVRDDLQDLTSLRARLDNCLMETDLNRRLAPKTYLGIIRVVKCSDGRLGLGTDGKTVDWLVKMRRLPADRMLDVAATMPAKDHASLKPQVERLAQKLIAFYNDSPVSLLGAAELLTGIQDQRQLNRACLLNPLFAAHHTRFGAVFDALDVAFATHLKLFEARVKAGWIRECHGDLRPEHVCLTPTPVVFDCLEFNRNLRLVDPFSEVVFLGMEAEMLGAAWIKPLLIARMASGLGTCPDTALLDLYASMHAMLRTRLCLAHLLVPTPRTPEKWMPLGLRYFKVAERLLCDTDRILAR